MLLSLNTPPWIRIPILRYLILFGFFLLCNHAFQRSKASRGNRRAVLTKEPFGTFKTMSKIYNPFAGAAARMRTVPKSLSTLDLLTLLVGIPPSAFSRAKTFSFLFDLSGSNTLYLARHRTHVPGDLSMASQRAGVPRTRRCRAPSVICIAQLSISRFHVFFFWDDAMPVEPIPK